MSTRSSIITVETLKRVMTQKEYRDYCSGLSKEETSTQIQTVCVDKVYDGTYTFSIKEDDGVFMNAHPKGSMEYLCQNLLIRKLNQNIMRAYRLKVVNRGKMVNQLKQLLQCEMPLQVLRKDIHHFFESTPPSEVMEFLKSEGHVTRQTQLLIEQLLSQTTGMGASGLPRGLSISSGLTEFYMRKFDYEFIRHEGLLLYCRFVDDMLFVCTENVNVQDIQEKVDAAFKRLGYEENTKKKQTITISELKTGKTFDFLGYKFGWSKKAFVNIADVKVKKIKTRMVIAFKQFLKDKDEYLIVMRMKYLTCVSSIESPALKDIRIGTPSNYIAVNDDKSLKELDTFYRGLVACRKGRFGTELQTLFHSNPTSEKKLKAINFTNSFSNRRRVSFSASELNKINKCWYE